MLRRAARELPRGTQVQAISDFATELGRALEDTNFGRESRKSTMESRMSASAGSLRHSVADMNSRKSTQLGPDMTSRKSTMGINSRKSTMGSRKSTNSKRGSRLPSHTTSLPSLVHDENETLLGSTVATGQIDYKKQWEEYHQNWDDEPSDDIWKPLNAEPERRKSTNHSHHSRGEHSRSSTRLSTSKEIRGHH